MIQRPSGGSPEVRIRAGNRLTTYRAARSAFPAVGLDPAGPWRESEKNGSEWRDSQDGRMPFMCVSSGISGAPIQSASSTMYGFRPGLSANLESRVTPFPTVDESRCPRVRDGRLSREPPPPVGDLVSAYAKSYCKPPHQRKKAASGTSPRRASAEGSWVFPQTSASASHSRATPLGR